MGGNGYRVGHAVIDRVVATENRGKCVHVGVRASRSYVERFNPIHREVPKEALPLGDGRRCGRCRVGLEEAGEFPDECLEGAGDGAKQGGVGAEGGDVLLGGRAEHATGEFHPIPLGGNHHVGQVSGLAIGGDAVGECLSS